MAGYGKPMADRSSPVDEIRRFFEDVEQRTADAMEEMVRRDSFGELVARSTENVMALTRIGFDVFDLIVRNLRIAGRQDVARLGRQLARTEDKLELVLQAVERLEDERAVQGDGAPGRQGRSGARSSSGGGTGGGKRRSGGGGAGRSRAASRSAGPEGDTPSGGGEATGGQGASGASGR